MRKGLRVAAGSPGRRQAMIVAGPRVAAVDRMRNG